MIGENDLVKGEQMAKTPDFLDVIRQAVIDFKYDRINLGDAMRIIKREVYHERDRFIYEGRIRQAKAYGKIDGSDK